MTSTDHVVDRVRARVAAEPVADQDQSGTVGLLQRLCRAAAASLPATGAGLSVVTGSGGQLRAAASDVTSDLIEELQFTLGEGPCIDSYASRQPVYAPDLAAAAVDRWPGYAPAAHAHGVRAVFAFPLNAGVARLGVLDVYRDRVGALSRRAAAEAIGYAEVAMHTLLEPDSDIEDVVVDLDDREERGFEVYQAQGMVMMQLGVSLDEAMSRLRAHAYRHDRRLKDVARDVLERRLHLERDD
jgi:hypothetical protein